MTTATTMMALGDFRFAIETSAYQELERKNDWRWAKIDRLMTKPARQFIGPGDDTISMRGTIYPHFVRQNAGLSQLPAMRALADQAYPFPLVDGNGRVWGNYCITTLTETQRVFFSDGTPRCIEFEIELAEYGEYNPAVGATPAPAPQTVPAPIQRANIQTQVSGLQTLGWS